jgi:hypothetical protein
VKFLALDPGISAGWCVLDAATGTIVDCGGGTDEPPIQLYGKQCKRAIIEMPFIYPHRNSTPPNDLMQLARRVGRYEARLEDLGVEVKLVHPAEWKGQLDKDTHHPRILAAVATVAEKKLVATRAKGLNKKATGDMLDALGLAQFAWQVGWARGKV